eukprot:PhM_4_TR9624/c0_g1_i4/m.13668
MNPDNDTFEVAPQEIPRIPVPDSVEGRRRALGFRSPAELNAYMMEQFYGNVPYPTITYNHPAATPNKSGTRYAMSPSTSSPSARAAWQQLSASEGSPGRLSAAEHTRLTGLSAQQLWDPEGLQQEMSTQTDGRRRYDVGIMATPVAAAMASADAAAAASTASAKGTAKKKGGSAELDDTSPNHIERHAVAPDLALPAPSQLENVSLPELVRMERQVGAFLHNVQAEATRAMQATPVEYRASNVDELSLPRTYDGVDATAAPMLTHVPRRQLEYLGAGDTAGGRITDTNGYDNPYAAPLGTNVMDSLQWAERMTERVQKRLKTRFRERAEVYTAEHERHARYLDHVRRQVERRRAIHAEVERLVGEGRTSEGPLNRPWLDQLAAMQGKWVDDVLHRDPSERAAAATEDQSQSASAAAVPILTLDEFVQKAVDDGEWKEATDPKTKKKYFMNAKTKKTVWDLKKELTPAFEKYEKEAKAADNKISAPMTLDEFVQKAIESGEWKEATDPKTKKKYFVNPNTKKTAWDLKKELTPAFEKYEKEVKVTTVPDVPPTLDEFVQKAVDDGEWKEATDPKTKKKYFMNAKTKKTVWDLKKELTPAFEKEQAIKSRKVNFK